MNEQADSLTPFAQDFVQLALNRFEQATPWAAQLIPDDVANPSATGQHPRVQLMILGKPRIYAASFQSIDRFHQIKLLVERKSTDGHPRLLIAPSLSTKLAAECRKEELAYLDGAGNAFITGDDHYILIVGKKPEPGDQATRPQSGASPAALRIVFALLRRPELAAANYRDIASAADTALGTVGAALTDLQNRRLLSPSGKASTRRLLDPRRLLDEWAALYPARLRPKLNARRFTAPEKAWWQAAVLPPGAVWGGEVAADHYTGYLKPEHITVYLDRDQDRQTFTSLVVSNRLRPDPAGEIEFLDRFWPASGTGQADERYAHRALVYADLIASADPRNFDTASRVKEQFLAQANDD